MGADVIRGQTPSQCPRRWCSGELVGQSKFDVGSLQTAVVGRGRCPIQRSLGVDRCRRRLQQVRALFPLPAVGGAAVFAGTAARLRQTVCDGR